MGIWYVKKMSQEEEAIKAEKLPLTVKKLLVKAKEILLLPTIKEIDNRTIVILPIKIKKNITEKQQEKLARKIAKHMYDKSNQNIVLSKELELPILKNTLFSNNCNLLDGRWLFSYLTPQIIQYVSERQEKTSQMLEVSIMVNDNKEQILKNIIKIAQKLKMLNIITNNIEKFRKIEEYLYKNMGIVVRITNNRKKALLKSNLIINYDFPEEAINKYILPKKAIIVNISEKISIASKRFSGINSNFYRISLPEKYRKWFAENNMDSSFDEAILYESVLYKKSSYESICKEIEENGSKIKYLVGNNGNICEEEYKILQ